MQVLIIDNNINAPSWGSDDLCCLVRSIAGVTIHVRRAPQNDLPKNLKDYDGVIVSGSKTSALDQSPWVRSLIEWTSAVLELKKPYLGVCFGHQILARTLGGIATIRRSAIPEFGWTQVQVIQKHSLFEDLPHSFSSFSAHFEEVMNLPKDCFLLGSSEQCQIQAFQWKNLPVYGIQFHPEKTLKEAQKILQEMREEKPDLSLLNPLRSRECFNPKIGELIIKNFLKKLTIS